MDNERREFGMSAKEMMEKIIEEMGEFKYNDFWQDKYEQLKVAVAAMDVDSCIEILNDWK